MKLRYLCLILLIVMVQSSYAQSQYRSSLQDYYLANSIDGNLFFKRLSLGGGLHFINGNADLHFMGFADSSYQDVKFKQPFHASQSYAFYIGSYVPIALISDNSMLVVNVEFMGCVSKLVYDSITFSKKTRVMAPMDAYKVGIPISLEYRSGSDVLLSKQVKMMFGFGAGFNLCLINSTDYTRINPYKMQPFIKAEIGFVAGLAFKIRAVYTPGTSVYNYQENYNVAHGSGDQLSSVFKGANGYNLSLIILPFSVNWNR